MNIVDWDNEDNLEVPTEDSTNSITAFSINSSKLISDKGSVKQKDMITFQKEGSRVTEKSKPLYAKSLTMKQEAEEEKVKRRFTVIKAERAKQNRNITK